MSKTRGEVPGVGYIHVSSHVFLLDLMSAYHFIASCIKIIKYSILVQQNANGFSKSISTLFSPRLPALNHANAV
jgi:hypothetical protein